MSCFTACTSDPLSVCELVAAAAVSPGITGGLEGGIEVSFILFASGGIPSSVNWGPSAIIVTTAVEGLLEDCTSDEGLDSPCECDMTPGREFKGPSSNCMCV